MNEETTKIEDQPHVVVFISNGSKELKPCAAPRCPAKGMPEAIDDRYAIYADRASADFARSMWSASIAYYFSVPASALFNIGTMVPPPVTTFTYKFAR